MRRILLVVENHNESMFIEGLLKKLGFDVESIKNEGAISEKILAFGPEIVIATGLGTKVDGGRVAAKVKRTGNIKLILLFPRAKLKDKKFLDSYLAEGALETPINPRALIQAICQFGNLDEFKVMAKFEKLAISQGASVDPGDLQIISGKVKEPKKVLAGFEVDPKADEGRSRKYEKYLENLPETGQNGLPSDLIRDTVREIHKNINDAENEEIDRRRKEFVRALYKK